MITARCRLWPPNINANNIFALPDWGDIWCKIIVNAWLVLMLVVHVKYPKEEQYLAGIKGRDFSKTDQRNSF